MYLFDAAYPTAKALLNSRWSSQRKLQEALKICRTHCPHPHWDLVDHLDFGEEQKKLTKFWHGLKRNTFPDEACVLWIALHDLPFRFSLRGAREWSEDESNWEWLSDAEFEGPTYESQVMKSAMFGDDDESDIASSGIADSPYEVAEMFLSLVVYAIYSVDAIRLAQVSHGILGSRKSRSIVIGHPDSECGIILGKRTKSRWIRHLST